MKIKIYSIVIFLLFHIISNADTYTDSLINELNKTKNAKTQIEILNELSWEMSANAPSTALRYALIAQEIAKNQNYLPELATSNNRIGLAYDMLGKYDSAVHFYQLAFNKRLELRDSAGAANILLNIGAAYYTQGFYNLALKNYLLCRQLIKLNEQNKNENTLAKAINNIGLIYRVKKDYKQAITSYLESLEIKRYSNDVKGIFNSYTNIALAWQNLGDYNKALLYNDSAQALIQSHNFKNEMAGNLINKAGILKDQQQFQEALNTISDAENWLNNIPDEHTEVFLYSLKGEILKLSGMDKLALEEYQKCLILASRLGRRELLQATYLAMSDIYEVTGNKEMALHFYRRHKQLSDSIFSIESQKYINELQAIYETKKNEEKINILNLENEKKDLQIKQKNLIIAFGSISVVLSLIVIILLIYFLRTNRVKNKMLAEKTAIIEHALTEKDILLREIHHRVKNNLQIITGLLEIQESLHENNTVSILINEAQGRIKTMSLIHELLYQTENISSISFSSYITKLTNSIESNFSTSCYPVKKTFKLFDLSFDIDRIIPIGLILNELINNSFKYVFCKQDDNELVISLSYKNNDYILSVSDNGPMPLNNPFENKQQSFGLKLVKMLARQLNGQMSYMYENGSTFVLTFKETDKL